MYYTQCSCQMKFNIWKINCFQTSFPIQRLKHYYSDLSWFLILQTHALKNTVGYGIRAFIARYYSMCHMRYFKTAVHYKITLFGLLQILFDNPIVPVRFFIGCYALCLRKLKS